MRPGLRDIEFSMVQAAVKFAQSPSLTQQRDLAAGLRVFIEKDELWLAAWEADLPTATGAGDCWPQVFTDVTQVLEIPGIVLLNDGWRLSIEIATPPGSTASDFWRRMIRILPGSMRQLWRGLYTCATVSQANDFSLWGWLESH